MGLRKHLLLAMVTYGADSPNGVWKSVDPSIDRIADDPIIHNTNNKLVPLLCVLQVVMALDLLNLLGVYSLVLSVGIVGYLVAHMVLASRLPMGKVMKGSAGAALKVPMLLARLLRAYVTVLSAPCSDLSLSICLATPSCPTPFFSSPSYATSSQRPWPPLPPFPHPPSSLSLRVPPLHPMLLVVLSPFPIFVLEVFP